MSRSRRSRTSPRRPHDYPRGSTRHRSLASPARQPLHRQRGPGDGSASTRAAPSGSSRSTAARSPRSAPPSSACSTRGTPPRPRPAPSPRRSSARSSIPARPPATSMTTCWLASTAARCSRTSSGRPSSGTRSWPPPCVPTTSLSITWCRWISSCWSAAPRSACSPAPMARRRTRFTAGTTRTKRASSACSPAGTSSARTSPATSPPSRRSRPRAKPPTPCRRFRST